jgi:hypothetical protein
MSELEQKPPTPNKEHAGYSTSKEYVQYVTFSLLWDIFAHLDPDLDNPNVYPESSHQNQCGYMRIRIRIHNTALRV